VDGLRDWIESLGVELVADASLGTATVEATDHAVQGTDAWILPASSRGLFPSPEHMARHSEVKVLSIAASGYEWLDLDAARSNGIVVTNAPAREGIEVVADQAFALMLAVARQIPYHHRLVEQGRLERGIGVSVWGKTLGIVGLGNIGKAVARRARGFDMRILATTRHPGTEFNEAHGVEVVSLDDLLRESDFVSLHARLNDETAGMIGARELSLMKRSAVLVNTARNGLWMRPH